jgi:hypothetical protein
MQAPSTTVAPAATSCPIHLPSESVTTTMLDNAQVYTLQTEE